MSTLVGSLVPTQLEPTAPYLAQNWRPAWAAARRSSSSAVGVSTKLNEAEKVDLVGKCYGREAEGDEAEEARWQDISSTAGLQVKDMNIDSLFGLGFKSHCS
ncbi:hypothetical protein E2562_026096 [Oryza meyeriana var. granulata]|uniref:Uncharacterized protein n=1 Tax=Oryza meyeriana var. granulata TaxID=110450 RepID=A0A6G1BZC2_9ORYZ|nr:hypothetical protein E2562_026096 [Oryza meyeriana var. granulata]